MELVSIGLYAIMSILASILLSPLVIRLSTGAKQPILHYVDNHIGKSGTPTMGGIIFVGAVCSIIMVNSAVDSYAFIAALATFSFALLGFVDDYKKVKSKNNLGLRAYQKIIFQFIIALLISLYCYYNKNIGSTFKVPFTGDTINLGWISIPLYLATIIAVVNSVNLTDGLDGLAATTGSIYFTTVAVMLYIMLERVTGAVQINNILGLTNFSVAFAGALFAFIVLNSFPAKIFMGDTGSLAIGGAAACVAIFSGNLLYIPILGIVFLISSLSVIIQVISFKLTGKRVFKMAPFHHHLERKGIHENKIVSIYSLITIIAAIICIILF